jgi:hypothetical protein
MRPSFRKSRVSPETRRHSAIPRESTTSAEGAFPKRHRRRRHEDARRALLLSRYGLAQMERELIVERTRAGLEAARCAGRVGGRKRRMTNGKGSGRPKAIGKRDGATRTGAQLRRVGSHVISLGTGLFTDVRGLRYEVNQRQHVAQLVKPALVPP